MRFIQLNDKVVQTFHRDISTEIADLIWQTDDYIYPCIFKCKDDALKLLSHVINSHSYTDRMFDYNNIYACITEDEHIIGIILWHKGPLLWDSSTLRSCAAEENIALSPYLSKAEHEYFKEYRSVPLGNVSLINVCVATSLRNQGFGKSMLSNYLSTKDENVELFVLKKNTAAISVYHSLGFKPVYICNGFSANDIFLPCYKMSNY